MQYKTHIWGHAEYQNAAICHAAPSLLAQIDAMQRRYLHELHLTEEVAFLDHNFLPPRTRRDVAMLGLIHKRILGTAHPAFAFLLPWSTTSSVNCRHNKQLYSGRDTCIGNHALFHRSILGRADMYNRLSQRLVDIDNITVFQSELTKSFVADVNTIFLLGRTLLIRADSTFIVTTLSELKIASRSLLYKVHPDRGFSGSFRGWWGGSHRLDWDSFFFP